MKRILTLLAASVALIASAQAIGAGRIESAKKRAADENKLVVFVVEQDYYDPACPKCISDVDTKNGSLRKAVPNAKQAVVIRLAEEDLKEGKVPDCVLKAGGMPRVVVTDAACTKVIDNVGANPDKARIEQMQEKITKALTK